MEEKSGEANKKADSERTHIKRDLDTVQDELSRIRFVNRKYKKYDISASEH